MGKTCRTFEDGHRVIDFVLAYQPNNLSEESLKHKNYFEDNLKNLGLNLEIDTEGLNDNKQLMDEEKANHKATVHFINIHAPDNVLEKYCEVMNINMALKAQFESEDLTLGHQSLFKYLEKGFLFVWHKIGGPTLNRNIFPEPNHELKYTYSKDKKHLFAKHDENFFTPSIRIAIVAFILEKTKFANNETEDLFSVGIAKMLNDKVYTAAYPLHDGNAEKDSCDRTLLNREWASLRKWITPQPLDKIKDYFGVQVALYFAWLGFYTQMLIPVSIAGIVCIVYGFFEMDTNTISKEICDSNITMCPACESCDTTMLREQCSVPNYKKWYNNTLTPWFALFVAVWATLYLEIWKRYSARIMFHWDMSQFTQEAQPPRPEYLARVKKNNIKKRNFVTNEDEYMPSLWKKYTIHLISYTSVLLFICLVLVAVIALIVVRVISKNMKDFQYVSLVSGVLNLSIIMTLNVVYGHLAKFLTNVEYQRTQTEYDESLALKIYLFQFVNYYSSLFYIAFVKGKFVGHPGNYNRILGKFRQEECGYGGCFNDLTAQLIIIMIGKQVLNEIKEMMPFVWKKFRIMYGLRSVKKNEDTEEATSKQWVDDYRLTPIPPTGLFYEYLEMVIQFGFVTIFVVAFPLAPLFALINNIFEIRLDAEKFVSFYRRTRPVRAANIGFWYNVMVVLQKMCVISSAFIIAFTGNFIDRFVYFHSVSTNGPYNGYLNFTLSYWQNSTLQCYYEDYRNPSGTENQFDRTPAYWKVLAYRLMFVVLFQNIVNAIQLLVDWAIPDIPRDIQDHIKREQYLICKTLLKEEEMILSQCTKIFDDETTEDHGKGVVVQDNVSIV